MKRTLLKLTGLALAAGALVGCGGGGDSTTTVITPPQPPQASPLEDMFGLGFGATFRLTSNGDPREPSAGDLTAVSFTTDPIAVP
jgi:hypothetical protein